MNADKMVTQLQVNDKDHSKLKYDSYERPLKSALEMTA